MTKEEVLQHVQGVAACTNGKFVLDHQELLLG